MTITKHFKIAHDEFILASSSRTLQRAALYVQGWKNEDDFPSCLYPIVFLEGFFCDAPDKVLDDAIQVALKCDRFVRSVDNSYDEQDSNVQHLHEGILDLVAALEILTQYNSNENRLINEAKSYLEIASSAELHLHRRRESKVVFDEFDRAARLKKNFASLIPFLILTSDPNSSIKMSKIIGLMESCIYVSQTIDDLKDLEQDYSKNQYTEILSDILSNHQISSIEQVKYYAYGEQGKLYVARALQQLHFRDQEFSKSPTFKRAERHLERLLEVFTKDATIVEKEIKNIPLIVSWG